MNRERKAKTEIDKKNYIDESLKFWKSESTNAHVPVNWWRIFANTKIDAHWLILGKGDGYITEHQIALDISFQ